MPGMMDTVLNLGLNDESVEGLAEQTGNRASPTTPTAA
jgi:pyruvate,orthophosphate dikinase